jgi:hypothetical protein
MKNPKLEKNFENKVADIANDEEQVTLYLD